MDEIKITTGTIWGMPEIMQYLNCSLQYATKVLHMKGCPVLPRQKRQHYKVKALEFIKWWESVA